MIVRNEGSLQAHWLDGCRSDPVADIKCQRIAHVIGLGDAADLDITAED